MEAIFENRALDMTTAVPESSLSCRDTFQCIKDSSHLPVYEVSVVRVVKVVYSVRVDHV